MDTRRQSGRWAQNPQTGFYEQQAQADAPYQYYQPPPREADADDRRSYSERTGNVYGSSKPNTVLRSDSTKIREATRAASERVTGGALSDVLAHGGTTSTHLANTQHINSTSLPGSSQQALIDIDPDEVPSNVRATAWSPGPTSPHVPQGSQAEPTRHVSNSSNTVRRGSVPDRSPLQKLEGKLDNIGKEEKRARVEEAENRARKTSVGNSARQSTSDEGELTRTATLRSEKGRVVSDGSRRPKESTSDRYYQDRPRQVSTGEPIGEQDASSRFRRASDALRTQTTPPLTPNDQDFPIARQRSTRERPDPPIAYEPRPYHHAPAAPRDLNSTGRRPASMSAQQQQLPSATQASPAESNIQRTASSRYKHRLRDAGFAGAAAAVAGSGVAGYEATAADRGKAAYERRKSQTSQQAPVTPVTPTSGDAGLGRSGSKKLSKRGVAAGGANVPALEGKQQLQTDRMGSGGRRDRGAAEAHQDPDLTSPPQIATDTNDAVSYKVPMQTAASQKAKDQVGSRTAELATAGVAGAGLAAGAGVAAAHSGKSSMDQPRRSEAEEVSPMHAHDQEKRHHRLGGFLHRHKEEQRGYLQASAPLDEWRNAEIARLSVADLEFDREPPPTLHGTAPGTVNDSAWWEKNRSSRRTSADSSRQAPPTSGLSGAQLDGPYEEEAKLFRPPLFLKCGPLLRYTGMRREKSTGKAGLDERVIWRGSIMVVTEDSQSDYSASPKLRIFAQPMDLHQPPSRELRESGHELAPEHEDPIAGQVKVSRTGRPLYVRPVHDIPDGVDLSREENNQGLYAATRTPTLGPQPTGAGAAEGRASSHITFQDKSRIKRRDGEKAGRYKEVAAARLHNERGFTFWRFTIEVELGSTQHRVAYRINKGPALGFWVPGRADGMNIMFHSCNGFSLSVNPDNFCGPDPLWRDVLNKHQSRPFHVMVGGGDQIYNDAATRDTTVFAEWVQIKNPEHKYSAEFTPEMQDELEKFFLDRYAMWFSQGLFAMAGSQIPMVNIWDDHDIIDGFGSYPNHFMSCKVFTGLGAVAFKYYMLFQHQSLVTETEKEEPSWLIGASPGPYIHERSRSVCVDFGPHVKFIGIDCRTERMRDEILTVDSYNLIFERLEEEVRKGETKHLIVLLGVPIAYPRLNFLENILTSRVMDPIKAIGKTGMLGGFVNKFDGGVEILDDLDDHWTAKHHKGERNWLIQELQELAAERSVRVTILGGDVHLGAIGQFYTPRKMGVAKDKDHRYMPNVISSAIVNTPPPPMMADVLNKRNKIHHLDTVTDEDLIPMFEVDVDGSKRNNKCLLPRRNYCTIREFVPGNTPPPTPRLQDLPPGPEAGDAQGEGLWAGRGRDDRDRRFPPGSMGTGSVSRTRSLTRGTSNLIRRLSGSRSKNPPVSLQGDQGRTQSQQMEGAPSGPGRSSSLSGPSPGSTGQSNFPPSAAEMQRPTYTFHRRPTNLSEKEIRRAAARGGAPPDDEADDAGPPAHHIDLKGGLDISLNMEVDQRDPSGSTQSYRLLVPALFYDGPPDLNPLQLDEKRPGLMQRLKSMRRKKEDDGYDPDDRSLTPTPPPSQDQQQQQPPPPQQQPPQPSAGIGYHGPNNNRYPTAASLGRTPSVPSRSANGNDGAYSQRYTQGAPSRRSMDATPSPYYDHGYNLSSPPIGAGRGIPQQQQSNTIDQTRRSGAPLSQNTYAAAPAQVTPSSTQRPAQKSTFASRDPDQGSLTPSEEYDDDYYDQPAGGQRRPSKAERFFGVDDVPHGQSSGYMDGEDDDNTAPRKKKWMIWK